VCKAIDPALSEITTNLTAKYIKKCMAMFDFYKTELYKALD